MIFNQNTNLGGTRTIFYKKEIEEKYEEILEKTPAAVGIANVFVGRDGVFCPHCKKRYKMLNGTHVTEDVEIFIQYMDDFPRPEAFLYTLCRACTEELVSVENNDQEKKEKMLAIIYKNVNSLYWGILKDEVARNKEKKFRYTSKLEDRLIERTRKYRDNGFSIDRYIFDHHSEECLMCSEPFTIDKGRIKNADGISFVVDRHTKIAFPYPQCKACMDKVTKLNYFPTKKNAEAIEQLVEEAMNKAAKIAYSKLPNSEF